uniref:Uncharacterized protein n=1 Tax=Panagrolaimus sp. PS1159 TaxID=55785 RepID=A0AC35G280_9BILA
LIFLCDSRDNGEPKSSSIGIAPPPYKINPDDDSSTSGRWSDSSFSSNSGIGKRRASWTNLVEADENLKNYKVNFFVMPRGSIQKLNYGTPMPPGATPIPLDNPQPLPHQTTITSTTTTTRHKRNRMEDIRNFFGKPIAKFICGVCCLLLIAGIVLAIVLPLNLILPNHYEFNWQAPEMIRQRQTGSNHIQLDIQGDQARFNLKGNAVPFRSNYLSVYDFKTNKIAVVDSALQNSGKQIICFKNNQSSGWQERWNFMPSPLPSFNSESNFHPDISECRGARWVQLTYVTANQKPQRCSDCYDFCLPSYGVQKDVIRDEEFLNIMNRDCFYLYVPEWRNYAQAYNNQPGQQGYQQQGYGTTNMYGQQPQTPTNMLNQQATGGIFSVGGNQFPNQGQLNHQQNRLGQYAQPGSPYGPGNGVNTIGGGGGGGGGSNGGAPGMSGFNTNYNEMNRNNNNDYNNNNNNQNGESRWINLSNVPGQIVNKTGTAINQVRNQVDQWGRKIGENLGILPNDDHFNYQNNQSPYNANNNMANNNQNNNPFDPRYNQGQQQQSRGYGYNSNSNNPNYATDRQQTLGSLYGTPGLSGMGPEYQIRTPIVGGETSSTGGFGQSQQPLLPSAVFTAPEESQRGVVGQQPILPSNPSEYFRNEQQSLQNQGIQLQNQAQHLQNQAAQTYGRDLSAGTLSPNQQDQLRNQQSFLNNWGRR